MLSSRSLEGPRASVQVGEKWEIGGQRMPIYYAQTWVIKRRQRGRHKKGTEIWEGISKFFGETIWGEKSTEMGGRMGPTGKGLALAFWDGHIRARLARRWALRCRRHIQGNFGGNAAGAGTSGTRHGRGELGTAQRAWKLRREPMGLGPSDMAQERGGRGNGEGRGKSVK